MINMSAYQYVRVWTTLRKYVDVDEEVFTKLWYGNYVEAYLTNSETLPATKLWN